MIITAELSLYPLRDMYEQAILSFIKELKQKETLKVYTTAMSTYVIGDSTEVFDAINAAMLSSLAAIDTASLVIKVINRPLPISEGFLNL